LKSPLQRVEAVAPLTVAVTGATGFVGRHLLPALIEAGYYVRALTRRDPPFELQILADSVAWVPGLLSQKDTLLSLVQGADAVVHCAGAIKALNRETFFAMNDIGTANVLEAALAQPALPRFVHISSLAAREPQLSPYAASKRLGEDKVLASRDKLTAIVLRPPAVYGPGDMETFRIFRMASLGFVPTPMISGARTSLVHVKDVVGSIMTALAVVEMPDAPIEFDDGRSGGYTWAEIAAAAGAVLQTSPRLLPIPAPLLYLAGAAGSLAAGLSRRPSVLSWGKVPEFLHPDWVAGPCALPAYNPLWNIEKGFLDAVNWYRSRGLLTSNG
jgi:nucleoside-diphosphate-sugar epimerase